MKKTPTASKKSDHHVTQSNSLAYQICPSADIRCPFPFHLRNILFPGSGNPAPPIQLLHLSVPSASCLPHADGLLNKIDPYVVALYGPITYQSTVFRGYGSNPKFQQDTLTRTTTHNTMSQLCVLPGLKLESPSSILFTFPYLENQPLRLVLVDHDYFFSRDDFLGQCVIDVSSCLREAGGHLNETDLTGEDGKPISRWSRKTARVSYSLWTSWGPWPAPALKAFKHSRDPTLCGRVREEVHSRWHKFYEISLMYISDIFGGSSIDAWNSESDNRLRIIDKDVWSSSVFEECSSYMYSFQYENKRTHTAMLKVEDGNEFLAFIKNGRRKRSNKPILYRYLILGSSLIFSEQGKIFLTDIVSKYTSHSGARTALVYSGEFHVSKFEGSDHLVIVFDNNSGKYLSDPKALPTLLTLLKANFPGVLIDCVDYNDYKLREYKQRAGLNVKDE